MPAQAPTQSEERVHIFGIRHHGPGSAALLRKALDALDPACILVEGPPEGDELIQYIADPDLKPPVAMLLHAADEENLASFMPFAEFSPEWQAIQWALNVSGRCGSLTCRPRSHSRCKKPRATTRRTPHRGYVKMRPARTNRAQTRQVRGCQAQKRPVGMRSICSLAQQAMKTGRSFGMA
jgi:hypothetical protein